jgi:F-type H+-transporting ATPase subunit gamma
MATLKIIRKRIATVKNTQKITKAMKMVAAAKLRRAQQALMAARPHRDMLRASLIRLVAAAETWDHPLLKAAESPKRGNILVLSSDKGLCGGFNGNLLRRTDDYLRHEGKELEQLDLYVIGRKGRDYYRAKKTQMAEARSLDMETFSFAEAETITGEWMGRFHRKEFDSLMLAFNSFKSAISQVPTLVRILPLDLKPEGETLPAPVIWEGSAGEVLEAMLRRYVSTLLYVAVLESQASELGARMSAMDNATNNASDMIGSLTLQYNRARQAAITTELMDIVNGAEALG